MNKAQGLTFEQEYSEQKCPECGHILEGRDDSEGRVYQCTNHTCLQMFDVSEIFDDYADGTYRA